MSEITRCRNAEINAEAELPTDALHAWRARGWEPISDSRTVEAADLERVDAENAAALAAPAPRATPVTRPTGTTAGDAGKNKEN